MNPEVTTPNGNRILNLTEVKENSKVDVDYDGEDEWFNGAIDAVQEWLELFLQRRLMTTAQLLTRDRFPCERFLELPYGPVQIGSITVSYIPDGGASTEFDASKYLLDRSPRRHRIHLQRGESWPFDTLQAVSGVTVAYSSGYGADATAVPALLKKAAALKIAALYDQRGEETVAIGAVRLTMDNNTISLAAFYAEGSPL